MIGIGTIFGWYRREIIDGDDEVALLHGDAETGYRAMSEPLVNIRATLAEATLAGDLEPDTATRLVRLARSVPYGERSSARLAATAPGPGPLFRTEATACPRSRSPPAAISSASRPRRRRRR